ncbi:MAG: hydrogenase nickel incorporation protein HypB [Dehalococcoidales bacterium]|jgi:hydrogenase nickel incorporation protein HypB|nr:hydrogenase nickel incorporation protein HypB [Dehalococcoidales bacterium]
MAIKVIRVQEDILRANDEIARQNEKLLNEKGVVMINVMSSPGAGKTTTLLKTIEKMGEKARIGVIEGDVASSVDAEKIAVKSVPVIQINTAGGCHLDANMLEHALQDMPLDDIDLLFIENVGNLICPAGFALGEQKNIMICSTPEGHDKPYKYPNMFTQVSVVLVNKMDIAPLLDFDMDEFQTAVKGLNPGVKIIPISAKTGEGMDEFCSWLEGLLKK